MEVQNIKKQVVTNFNKYYKPVLYVIVGLGILYGAIYLFTPKPQMPAEYKALIDSLKTANENIVKRQQELSDSINLYKSEVDKVDSQIDNIKEKTTIIKEYHHEVIQQVDHYDATQVDNFFKTRYNY